MSDRLFFRAYAKINLFLRIKGISGTYHEIETLNQSINLFDELLLEKRSDNLITSDFPQDNSLLVLERIQKTFGTGGMHLSIRKGIPIGGGLGGSSADAAAAAIASTKLWHLDEYEVKKTVAPLFGDLAFQMAGGTAIARGFGDIIVPLPDLPTYHVLLAFPSEGVSTKEAYALSDTTPRGTGDIEKLYDLLKTGKPAQEYYLNDLLPAAILLNKEIPPVLASLFDKNAILTGMSGSGSTLFSLYKDREDAEKKAKELSCKTILTSTISPFLAN